MGPPVNCHYGLWIYSKPKYGPQIWSQKSTNLIHQYHTEWRLYHPPFSYIHSLSIYLFVVTFPILICLCVYCNFGGPLVFHFPSFCWRRSFSLSVCLHPLCLQSSSFSSFFFTLYFLICSVDG